MTRKTTWSNSDSLVIGNGPNFPERSVAAVETRKQATVVAKLHITWETTFGSTGASVVIPAGSLVKNVYLKTTTNWAGGTSLAFGDAGDTSGWITATQAAVAHLITTESPLTALGAYAYTATEGQLPPKVFGSAGSIYVTKVGTFTAGEADLFVEYV